MSASRTSTDSNGSDEEAENARAEITALFQKMQRAAAEKRRKKRDEIEASYTKELAQAKASAIAALDAGEQDADQRRMLVLQKLEDLLQRRREVEAKIMAELGCVEDRVATTLRNVEDAIGQIELLVGSDDNLKEEQ